MTERIAIIGGGIIGVALARALAQRQTGEVTLFEKEDRLAEHQTGHNSGVVHAGLYYAEGSLKARLCAAGRVAIKEFCLEKSLPYRELGKLVVALDDSELTALADIEKRSRANGVPGLVRIEDSARLREIEPHVAGVAALHSPHTAVVDYASITEAMAQDVRASGGTILLGQEVTALAIERGRVRVTTPVSDGVFDRVIVVCRVAVGPGRHGWSEATLRPRSCPSAENTGTCRGRRTTWSRAWSTRCPTRGSPSSGVHFTRGVYDDVHMGPNAVPALAREGYNWSTISLRDTLESLRWPGALPLAKRHWRMGIDEIGGSLIKSLSYRKAQRFIPELKPADLAAKASAGVRAQAWGRDGSLVDDFAVDQVGPVTLLRNAPSPAATSSLSIAQYILENYLQVNVQL